MGTSSTTGQTFYSKDWEDVKDVTRTLNIGEGKLSQINQPLVEKYQEMVDREIDSMLSDLYWVPLKAFNQYQPDGTTKGVFPGDVRRLARFWTAGLLLRSEFQGLEPNANEGALNYIEDARRELYKMIRFNHRIQGQVMKHGIRTMLPTMAPPAYNEPDF